MKIEMTDESYWRECLMKMKKGKVSQACEVMEESGWKRCEIVIIESKGIDMSEWEMKNDEN